VARRARSAVRGGGRPADLTRPIEALTFGRLRGFDRLDQALLLLSIASSVLFMATRVIQPFPGSAVLKGLGVAPLAVLAYRVLGKVERVPGAGIRDSWILTAALALSSAGDVFLQLGFRRFFVHALALFLLAQLAYIWLFTRRWPRPLRASAGEKLMAALVIVHGVVLSVWIWDGLGRLLLPGLAYGAALVAMTVSAILARFSRPLVPIGALLFLFSDSLIAAGFKVSTMSLAALLIWPTYYIGQYAITFGFLQEKAAVGRPPAR
jgi:uncharacterized membrane protein YhhN